MPKNDHYVIIGNGPAGNLAADTLRDSDPDARITIVSNESMTYYYRHKLTEFIKGKAREEDLTVRPYSVYKDKNIRLRLGQQVDKIDPNKKIIYLKHMETVSYTKLIIATGASPRALPSVSNFSKCLNVLSTYSDALAQIPMINKNKTFLVLGGDIISFKFIRMLKDMGKEVTTLLYSEAFWPFSLEADMAQQVKKSLSDKGVTVISDDHIKSVKKSGEAFDIVTEKGLNQSFDSVYSFLGMIPNIRFILGSGIDTDRGILVDDHLKTNFDDVYAAGDCAQIYNPDMKSYWLSIGWNNAKIQGTLAAQNLLGAHKVINPAPQKILEVEGLKINTSWWESF
ncbi:MAG: FAD-dependent oxidoreductase [Proteobacteria bacterium]|nr:FAD-dependent oxidoreductase [Pseudomonadota bacterium]